MKKYLLNMGIIIFIGVITLCFLIGSENPLSLIGYVTKLSIKWVSISFICIALYWGLETVIQHLLVDRMHKGCSLWNSFKVVMSGHFFNAITPFASGGQPMQAFIMMKQGIPLGTSASVLLSKFIIYQMTLTIYSMLVLALSIKFFITKIHGIIYLSLIGFFINLGVVIVLVMAAFMKERSIKIGFWATNLAYKLHIIKDTYNYKKKIFKQIELFNVNIKEMRQNKRLLVGVSLLTIGQLTSYFLIPYAVYRSFGFAQTEVFIMIAAAAFILMVSSFVPIPGASGVAEGSFFILFQLFFPQSILPVAVLCWRIITFYVPLCVGGIITTLPNQQNRNIKLNATSGL